MDRRFSIILFDNLWTYKRPTRNPHSSLHVSLFVTSNVLYCDLFYAKIDLCNHVLLASRKLGNLLMVAIRSDSYRLADVQITQ